MTTSHWQGGIPFLKKTIYIEKKAVAHESRLSHLGIWPTSKMRIHPLEVVMMHEGCLYDENGACGLALPLILASAVFVTPWPVVQYSLGRQVKRFG